MYPEHCRRSSVRQAHSYGLKHRAEHIGPPPYHISNGAMIAAAGMACCRIQQQETHGRPEMNDYLYLTEPSLCGDKGTKRGNRCRKNLIPAGSRNRLCDDCRQARPGPLKNHHIAKGEKE